MPKTWIAARHEQARDTGHVVAEPTHETEFEVQASLWSGLRANGINARGEVKATFCGRAQVRFDIAIFEAGVLVAVIECKRHGKQAGSTWEKTRQGGRYAQYGVPMRLVRGMDQARAMLADLEAGRLWWRDESTP